MKKELTTKDLKKNWPDWKIESPEQEKKALEFLNKAMNHLQEFAHPDPIQEV